MASEKNIVVLVGLMGAGKSRVGIELAKLLRLDFVDSDREIEKAAGLSIAEIFEKFGEAEFRKGEKKVMLRLLAGAPKVLASGGGAFMQEDIKRTVKERAVSVWLHADLDTLVERTGRTDSRPLLRGVDRGEKLKELIAARYPVYAEADITVKTDGETPQRMARTIRDALAAHGYVGNK